MMQWFKHLWRKLTGHSPALTSQSRPAPLEVQVIDLENVKSVIPIAGPPVEYHAVADEGTPYAVAACGHPQWHKATLYLGTTRLTSLTQERVLTHRQLPGPCFDCLSTEIRKGMAACTFCGHPIMVGDAVALYHCELNPEQLARAAIDPEGNYLGCLRMDCCPSGGFMAGLWNGSGVNSPYETGSMVGDVYQTGQVLTWSSKN